MNIIADQNIPLVKESFSDIGTVKLLSGRDINNLMLKDCDILLVRSITKVDKNLLENSNVKFIGTATIGTDHVDEDYLKQRGIKFVSAPGSNADSVAEYLVSALLNLEKIINTSLSGKTIGIIGYGNVGSRVKKRSSLLGLNCLINDPPLERSSHPNIFLPVETVLRESDIVTVHVPLIKTGVFSTYKMINNNFISKIKKGAILINTSRGSVMDEDSIIANREKLGTLVLDVWNNEPKINTHLLDMTDIASPHIAGYSYDGKIKGTMMLYNALCDFLSLEKKFDFMEYIRPEKPLIINLTRSNDIVFDAIDKAYPIINDDRNLRKIKDQSINEQGNYFDRLRKEYPVRREFFNHTLLLNKNQSTDKIKILENLGFIIKITN